MNNLSTQIAAFAVLLVGVLWWYIVKFVSDTEEFIRKSNTASKSLAKLTKIEAELTEHADSIASLHQTLHKLRSRVGMRELRQREKTQDIAAEPDARTDPAGWKQHMRVKLAQKNFK